MKKIRKPEFRICNDTVFKELFSKNPNALLLLISDVLGLDYDAIKFNSKIESSSELYKTRENNKTTVCDFIVKIGDYFTINCELNKEKYTGLTERNLTFVSRILSNSIPRGTDYKDLPKYKVAQLNINCFSNQNGKILAKMILVDADTVVVQTESLFIYNFDIAKCYNIYYNKEKRSEDANDKSIKWGTILYTRDTSLLSKIIGDDLMPKDEKEKFIKTAKELEEKHKILTEDDLLQLTEYKMAGERLFGLEQGITQKNTEIVTNMLNKEMDINLISEITGLNEEEIMKIKESL